MRLRFIPLLGIAIALNTWANTKSCHRSGYEYRACILSVYQNEVKRLDTAVDEFNLLVKGEEKKLFDISNESWNRFQDSSCKLENVDSQGTTGWQSHVHECMTKKIKHRILEIERLIRFKQEDQEPL